MATEREYLYSIGLTKAPTGRGRFSNDAKLALAKARKEGMTFDVVNPKPVAVNADINPKAVRKWANENGYTLGERGRISGTIKQAYLDSVDEKDRPAAVTVKKSGDLNDFRPAYMRYSENTVFEGTDSAGDVHKVNGKQTCDCGYSLMGHTCDNPTALVSTKNGLERIKVMVSNG